MNAINKAILSKINSLAPKGRYIILSEEEIADDLDGEVDGESLSKACKELSRDGYIDLKYSGGGMFCLAPLKDLEPEPEIEPEIIEDNERTTIVKKTGTAAAFFAALLGGAVGSLISSLILSVI